MSRKKVSELPHFYGKHLALVAQKKGVEAMGDVSVTTSASDAIVLGLCQLMAENNIGGINHIVDYMEEAK